MVIFQVLLPIQELLETSKMKEAAEDYALIYQVAEIIQSFRARLYEQRFFYKLRFEQSTLSQVDGKTVKHYRVVTEKDRLASV